MDREETRRITFMESQWMLFDMLADSFGYADANALLNAIATGEVTVAKEMHRVNPDGFFIPTTPSPKNPPTKKDPPQE